MCRSKKHLQLLFPEILQSLHKEMGVHNLIYQVKLANFDPKVASMGHPNDNWLGTPSIYDV